MGRERLALVVPALFSSSSSIVYMGSALKIAVLGAPPSFLGLANLLYSASYAASSWIMPQLLRGVPRKTVLTALYSVGALICLAIALSNSVVQVVALQAPLGFVNALAFTLQTALFVDLLRARHRAIYRMYLSSGIGFVLGSLTASAVRRVANLSLATSLSAASLACAAAITTVLPAAAGVVEAGKVVAYRSIPTIIAERMRQLFSALTAPRGFALSLRALRKSLGRTIPLFLAGCSATFISIYLFFSVFPIYLRRVMGLSDSVMFLLPVASGSASTAVYALLSRREIDYKVMWRAHIAALLARTALFASPLALGRGLSMPFAAICFYLAVGLTWAFIGSAQNLIMVNLSEPERKDERLGQLNGSVSVGSIAGSIAATALSYMGYHTVFLAASAIMVLAALLNVAALRTVVK